MSDKVSIPGASSTPMRSSIASMLLQLKDLPAEIIPDSFTKISSTPPFLGENGLTYLYGNNIHVLNFIFKII